MHLAAVQLLRESAQRSILPVSTTKMNATNRASKIQRSENGVQQISVRLPLILLMDNFLQRCARTFLRHLCLQWRNLPLRLRDNIFAHSGCPVLE